MPLAALLRQVVADLCAGRQHGRAGAEQRSGEGGCRAELCLIGLPLLMAQGTIQERMKFHDQAVQSVAADSARAQTIIGPILVLPYAEALRESDRVRAVPHRKLVFPNELKIDGKITAERRHRGIHQVLTYSGGHRFAGHFTLPSLAELKAAGPSIPLGNRQDGAAGNAVAGRRLRARQPAWGLGLAVRARAPQKTDIPRTKLLRQAPNHATLAGFGMDSVFLLVRTIFVVQHIPAQS